MTGEQQVRAAALAAAVALNGQLPAPLDLTNGFELLHLLDAAEKMARWIEEGVQPVPR